jgi:hypothetical protein
MDADDMMRPDRLAQQVGYLDSHPDVDVVGSGAFTLDARGNPIGARGIEPPDTSPASVLTRGLFVHPTIMGRVEWFPKHPYDSAWLGSEDRELWLRALPTSRFGHIPLPLMFYRETDKGPAAYLNHYIKAARYQEMTLRKYGPACAGRVRTAALILRLRLKCHAYRAATALGAQPLLMSHRNRPLSEQERIAATEGLNLVKATCVPGLD